MRLKTAIAFATIFLSSITYANPWKLFIQPSDTVQSSYGYHSQVQPIEDSDDWNMVARQSALGGEVVLWLGKDKTKTQVVRAPKLMQIAQNFKNIKYVYLYDEMFWDKDKGFVIGQYEDEILYGAKVAHANGLKTIVTILPDVILHPDFKLKDINAFDGISIDVYPSIRPSRPSLGSCSSGLNNYMSDLFYCSVQKLRNMDFIGDIGLTYQAFAISTLPVETTLKHLQEQRVLIDNAAKLGAFAVAPWGMWLGRPELEAEPYLVPLGNTKLQQLVEPN